MSVLWCIFFQGIQVDLNNRYQIQNIESMSQTEQIIYFPLLEKLGTNGRYQRLIAINLALQLLLSGMFGMGPGFFFLEIDPICERQKYIGQQCQDYVCSLQPSDRSAYYVNRPDTIPYAFSKLYVCQQHYVIGLLWTINYVADFPIVLLFSYLMDNYGRKLSWIIALCCTIIGYILMIATSNIIVFAIGMVIGPNCSLMANVMLIVLNEQVDHKARQNYQILVQIAWTVGGLIIPWAFYLIPHWRTLIIITQIIPSAISLVLLYWTQQNPKFLIKRDRREALEIFAKIGKMNGKQDNPVTDSDIEQVLRKQLLLKKPSRVVTPYDFLKFGSLRVPMIFGAFILACITIFYFGAEFVLDSFGLNIYLNQTVLMITQLLAFIPVTIYVTKMPRRLSGIIMLPSSAAFTLIILFIKIPEGCVNCTVQYIQLGLICIAKFITSAYYFVFILYLTELFPESARANGYNLVSIIQSCLMLIVPYLNDLESTFKISPMLVFTICGVLGGLCCIPLKETYNKLPLEQIEELAEKSILNQVNASLID